MASKENPKGELFDKQPQIIDAYFEDEIKTSYLNYAYSVITGRAIPDAQDGMKPVQRRILYGMAEMAVWHDKPTKKSARIVGDVMGKYHPHGDSSIYMAMVKMAQDFHLRYPMVIGQGNFGSIDDDPPAAMRYTEAKLSPVAEFLLEDMDKDTVDFIPNYDDTLKEPAILPGKFPNLLCNGTTGIAVGLATDIPPHNFNEVADAISAYIADPAITVDGLMKHVKGPDFPTQGVLTDSSSIRDIYEKGYGSVELAGKMSQEEKGGHVLLVITEIPYRVVKSKLVEEITNLYLDSENKFNYVLKGVREVRDESSKEGVRIVIECYKDANLEAIRTAVYSQTSMKVRLKVNMTALVKNHPRVLNLKDLIEHYVEHRRNVIIRRTKFDLDKAEARIHIVNGLLIALQNIDEVVKTIKQSKDTQTARANLMAKFKLTEIQADAILDMKLQKLTSLETNKLVEEKEGLEKLITELKGILASPAKRDEIIRSELAGMKEKIGDERKTKFETIRTANIDTEELISNDPMILTVSKKGILIREVGATLKTSTRGTKGRKGDATDVDRLEADDYIFSTVAGYLKDTVLIVTDSGRTYSIKGYEIKGMAEGKITRSHIKNIERLREITERGEAITAVLLVSEFSENNYIMFITRLGKGAKIQLSDFESINRNGVNSVKLKEGDSVTGAVITDGNKKCFVVKRNAKGFRFDEKLFPVHNRGVGGEKATSVKGTEEEVLGMGVADPEIYVIFITKDGKGKKVQPTEFSELLHRGAKGFKLVELGKNRTLASFALCTDDDMLLITTRAGRRIFIEVTNIQTNLLKLIEVSDNDEVSSISAIRTQSE